MRDILRKSRSTEIGKRSNAQDSVKRWAEMLLEKSPSLEVGGNDGGKSRLTELLGSAPTSMQQAIY